MKVRILLKGDQWGEVEAQGYYGGFAIHDSLMHPGCYTITHIATGKRAWEARSLGAALRVAKYLEEESMAPSGPEADQWAMGLSRKARTELFYRLEMIAPRPVVEDVVRAVVQ